MSDCPDCNENGGNGPRCLRHEEEYITLQIEVLREELEKVRTKIELEVESEVKYEHSTD